MNRRNTGAATFIRGNEQLDKLLARPDIAAGVAEVELAGRLAGAEDLDQDGEGGVEVFGGGGGVADY